MAVKAVNYKNWCTENISPQSWQRLLLRSVEVIRQEGYTIKDFENPTDELMLSEAMITNLNNAMEKLYELKIEEAALT